MTTHEHRTVRDWCLFFENLDDRATQLSACEAARNAWAEGLDVWFEHAVGCARCREIARIEGFLADGLDCPECLAQLQALHDLLEVTEHYEPITVLELQRGDLFAEELEALPLEQQLIRVLSEHQFQQWGFAQKLLIDAQAAWHRDPEHAHDRALLAEAVAGTLDPESYGARWIADLEAKAHAYLGNAHRILGRFSLAEREFLLAEKYLRQGVRSGLMEARVFALKVSLLKDQHRHAEALALLDRVERYYVARRDDHEVGRLILKRAAVLELMGEPGDAAEECARASVLLDPQRDSLLPLLAQKNTVYCLVAAGDLERARALFDELPAMPEPMAEMQRRWVEGNLLRAEKHYGAAREVYETVRATCIERGLFYHAALASLDLAIAAFAENANHAEVRHMAEEAAVYLATAGAKAEAFQALHVLLSSLHKDALTLSVLEQVHRRLATLQPA